MKGFSLIELLAVIIILGIIATIAYPEIANLTKKSEDSLYQEQIDHLESVANTWLNTHLDKVGYSDPYYLQFEELYDDALITSSDVLNPKTEQSLSGCIEIKWDDTYHQHIITYLERCPV